MPERAGSFLTASPLHRSENGASSNLDRPPQSSMRPVRIRGQKGRGLPSPSVADAVATPPTQAERPPFQDRTRLFIGGEWVEASGGGALAVLDSHTEQEIGRVPSATHALVDRAVAAARRAQPAWAATPPAERAAALGRLHDELKGR